jgi:hypothetical protein
MPSGRNTLVLSLVPPSSALATGAVITAPKPNPATAIPVIRPRRSGNHLASMAIGVMYAAPRPMPPIAPYVSTSSHSCPLEDTSEASMTPTEYRTTPPSATGRGPRRSWIRPPIRLPMKIVPITTSNGSTASDLDQPNWPCNGLLNTLHAYTAPSAS